MEYLIEHGPGDIAAVFGRALELAMQIERERFLRVGPSERTAERKGYANGYKPKRIDTPAGTLTVAVPKAVGHDGAQVVVAPTALMAPQDRVARILVAARARLKG